MKLSTTDLIILSYIKKHRSLSMMDLQSILNISSQGIADAFVDLCNSGYINQSTQINGIYELTDAVDSKLIPDWEYFFSSRTLLSIPEYRGPFRIPHIPIIKSVNQLNTILRMSEINLNYQYHEFQIKTGLKIRTIYAPSIKLKIRQKWILQYILSNYSLPFYVHGYVKGKSIKTNAESHIGKKEILCLDLKNYFPSIPFDKIIQVFRNLGYSNAVSTRLAQICTYKRTLPQGGVTSPMIANIVALNMDSELYNYSLKNDCVYTRYADDLTFSWNKADIKKELYPSIEQIICNQGFRINDHKTHVMKSPYRKLVTGLVVTDSNVKVPSKFKKELKKEIYYCQKYGVSSHLQYTGREHITNFMEYLYGKAYYVKMIEPEIGESFLKQLDQIMQTTL